MADDVQKEEVTEAVEAATEAVEDAKEEVQEAVEAVEEAAAAVEEVKEVVEDAPAAPAKEEKGEPTGKFADMIKQIETMSVLELSELVKALEDRFGVSAAAPMMMAGGAAPAAAGAAQEEEKSAYNVVLTSAGANKISVIKAVREILPELGLKEAKDLVDAAPGTVKENMKKEEAQAAKEKLEAAGATVELQ